MRYIELPSMIPQGVFLPRTRLPSTWYSLSLPTTAKGMLSCWQTRHTCTSPSHTLGLQGQDGTQSWASSLEPTFPMLIRWSHWWQGEGSCLLKRALDWKSQVLSLTLTAPPPCWLASVSQLSFSRTLCTVHSALHIWFDLKQPSEPARRDRRLLKESHPTDSESNRCLTLSPIKPTGPPTCGGSKATLLFIGPFALPGGFYVQREPAVCSKTHLLDVYLLQELDKLTVI